MRESHVKTMPLSDYWQLVGLLTLARRYNRMLRELEEAACALTGDEPNGLTADAIYSDTEAPDLLKGLGVEVEEAGI